ncbi:MAG: c-type cytochrome [Candidatus Acidiferrales bacterium]
MSRGRIALVCVVLLLALTLFGWSLVRRGFGARDNPSALETYVARGTRNLSIPAAAKKARNPFVASPALLTEAREHFADHCSICHGNDGSGQTAIGRNLYPKAPDMRLPETQNLTDGEMYYIIHNGIRLTGMPAWGDPNNDPDSWKLVLFIRHLPKITPEGIKDMERFNPRSEMERSEEKEEEEFLNGEEPKEPPSKSHH